MCWKMLQVTLKWTKVLMMEKKSARLQKYVHMVSLASSGLRVFASKEIQFNWEERRTVTDKQ